MQATSVILNIAVAMFLKNFKYMIPTLTIYLTHISIHPKYLLLEQVSNIKIIHHFFVSSL